MPAPSDTGGAHLRFDRTSTPGELVAKHGSLEPGASTGEIHRVAGRIQTTRGHGKVAFADLGDWGGKIQLFGQAARLGDRFEDFLALGVGDWVGASGEVVTRSELLERVWGSSYAGFEHSVEQAVHQIRRELKESSWIETVRGTGYRFVIQP